jgi:hypothetical protein
MNEQDKQLAAKIWPQHVRHTHAKLEARRKHARDWMVQKFGRQHLLSTPINRG